MAFRLGSARGAPSRFAIHLSRSSDWDSVTSLRIGDRHPKRVTKSTHDVRGSRYVRRLRGRGSAAPKAQAPPLSRRRAIAVWSLAGVATLLVFVSSLTVWVKRQILDSNARVDTSGQLLENPEIRGAL
jgi:hypothetical protein